jgi:hypothetical protein
MPTDGLLSDQAFYLVQGSYQAIAANEMGTYLDGTLKGTGTKLPISSPMIDPLIGNKARTYNAWILMEPGSKGGTIISHGQLSSYNKSSFDVVQENPDETSIRIDFQVGWAGTKTRNLADGSWHQITASYDPTATGIGVAVYIDGVAQNVEAGANGFNKAAVNTISSGKFSYGYAAIESGHELIGRIANTFIWDRALSPSEVKDIASPTTIPSAGLIDITYVDMDVWNKNPGKDLFTVDALNGGDSLIVYDGNSDGSGAVNYFSNTTPTGAVILGYKPSQLGISGYNIFIKP